MKNFFLYYNKNNHILHKELIYNESENVFYSESVDEPFFVVGLYIDGKKFNSIDLNPYEQAFALSDYNDLKNVQPNHFRDPNTELVFNAQNIISSGSLMPFGSDSLHFKFNHIFMVESLDSSYCLGTPILFQHDFLEAQTKIIESSYNLNKIVVSETQTNANVWNVKVADFYLLISNSGAMEDLIKFYYFPLTGAFFVSFDDSKVSFTPEISSNGNPFLSFVNSDASTGAEIFISNYPLSYANM